MEGLYRQREDGERKLLMKERKELFQAGHQGETLVMGLIRQGISLMLIRKFQIDS